MRKTPLGYARDGDVVYCFSGWGTTSDWYRNVKADPLVSLEVGKDRWQATAKLVHAPTQRERVLNLIVAKYGPSRSANILPPGPDRPGGLYTGL